MHALILIPEPNGYFEADADDALLTLCKRSQYK